MLSLALHSTTTNRARTRFTPDAPPPAPELGRRFAEACRAGASGLETDLRAATVALVERLKADDLPPERVVVAVKTAIATYGEFHVPPSLTDARHDDDGHRRAMTYQRVFGWCLDAYYGG